MNVVKYVSNDQHPIQLSPYSLSVKRKQESLRTQPDESHLSAPTQRIQGACPVLLMSESSSKCRHSDLLLVYLPGGQGGLQGQMATVKIPILHTFEILEKDVVFLLIRSLECL